MKLKLVVASMSVLGLISCPALAATKHKHHHKVKHSHAMASHDYKAMGGLAVQPAPVMEAMPRVDTFQTTLDNVTQSNGRGHVSPDWFNRIGINGGLNFDAHWGQRSQGFVTEDTNRFSVNDAYLNVNAVANEWTKVFASMSFNNTAPAGVPAAEIANQNYPNGVYSNVYTNNALRFDQAYVTFSNFDCSPFFVQVGKQFQDFGRYTIHPQTRTLAQSMSESLQTSAKVGFLTRMGLNGSVYTFENPLLKNTDGHTHNIYGASLGFEQPSDQLGYDLGISYMSHIVGANDVQAAVSNFEANTAGAATTNTYNHAVAGVAAYGDVNSGPFSLSARYTAALQSFNATVLSTQYRSVNASGAKPWAADITAGYGFNAWNKNQNVFLGYQATNNAVNLLLPRSRWALGYKVNMLNNLDLGLELDHDTDYSTGNGGSGKTSNLIGARAGVKFG